MREGATKLFLPVALVVGAIYFFSDPVPQNYYDYTFRIAESLLHGSLGMTETPPRHLNEFVPVGGVWYSVFPLGSVLTMIPVALLKAAGIIRDMPAALIAALLAVGITYLLLKIGWRYDLSRKRSLLMVLGIMFGTWTWTNLTFAGAWQLALGFAMLGELGAIYFTVFERRPLLAGAFFALGFGNRTEVLLTAPILIYLLARKGENGKREHSTVLAEKLPAFRVVALFCVLPLMLGVATLAYNCLRFGSPLDFGYSRIPGVLNEPWYTEGIFSVSYIPRQAWEMLLKPWRILPSFPYLEPDPFSTSILISSPFILFTLRRGARDKALKICAWSAIVMMTVLLWTHGNSGGWQFGYRYWMVCLPWIFLILLEAAPTQITRGEWAAYGFSFVANAYATWLFHWTNYLKP